MNKKSQILMKFLPLLGLACLLAAGGYLRIRNLGACSFWVDEVNTFYCAQSWNRTGKMVMPSGMVNERAPLYTALTAAGLKLFGEDEKGTRMPAALFGLASVLLAYGLAKRLFDRNVGLVTAFFMTFSPFEVGWSRTARMYTLLQMLVLFLIWAFVRGFEGNPLPIRIKRTAWSRPWEFTKRLGISPAWLAVFAVVLAATFYGVHFLVIFLIPGLVLYAAGVSAVRWALPMGRAGLLNKYSATALIGIFLAVTAYALLPGVRNMVGYFLSYTPSWASGESSARSRTVLLDFLISDQQFPLAVFFFIGTLMTVSRRHRGGWMAWCLFTTVFAMLSLVFSHRVPAYLFFVYPFFLMIAAFGFSRLVEGEAALLGRDVRLNRPWIRGLFAAAALSVFFLSPWMRIGLHIPFFGDGKTNMAVTPEEWREASQTVLSSRTPEEPVITSLPQAALFYGLRSDYCLNAAALEQSKTENFPLNANGRRVDMYAGAVCIENLNELSRFVEARPEVWVLISEFHFNNSNYIPRDIRAYLFNRFGTPAKTRNGTVLLLHRRISEDGRQ